MSDNKKPVDQVELTQPELIIEEPDMDDIDFEMLLPQMNVGQDLGVPEEKECIVKDESLLNLYDEILNNCRQDRSSIDEILPNLVDMVMNEGDASSASKEALVNLIKIKSDTADKMSKVADLMTRIKLKEQNTFPRFLAAQQNNKVVINDSKRDFLKSISKMSSNKANNEKKN